MFQLSEPIDRLCLVSIQRCELLNQLGCFSMANSYLLRLGHLSQKQRCRQLSHLLAQECSGVRRLHNTIVLDVRFGLGRIPNAQPLPGLRLCYEQNRQHDIYAYDRHHDDGQ